ncbi:hypothetical protein LXA43DRAFT_1043016, partial [Ganoderma leucocontextum]
PVAARFPIYGVCNWCSAKVKPGGGGDNRIRKCGGCSDVAFKKCQTEAWPTHKHMSLTLLKEQAAEPSYSESAASIPNIVKRWAQWADIYMWSLRTIVQAVAHQTDGAWVVFVLSPRMPDANNPNNPSEAYHIEEVSIVNKDEESLLRVEWADVESACKSMAEFIRAKLTEAERRMFAGVIPTVFRLKPTGWVSFHPYPLYRLRAHGGGPSYKHSRTKEERMLFNDVVQLCVGGINLVGLVLRAPRGDNNQPLPDAGFYMQLNNSWIWVRSPNWEWETVGDSAAEMLRRYHKLLAQRNFNGNKLVDTLEC